MEKHPDSSRLSAFLDGDLAGEEVRELELHLERCSSCSSLLQDLKDIKEQAGILPDLTPPRDLWPQIERTIEGREGGDPDVIRLHPIEGTPRRSSRRGLSLTIPQAAAAGIVLALFSGLVGARLNQERLSIPVSSQAEAALGEGSEESWPSWVRMVGETRPALESTALEVARLERTLAEAGENLDSLTARILEKNLKIIDDAIQESLAALWEDPGNRFLEENLERAILAKGDYLRDAALLVVPIS